MITSISRITDRQLSESIFMSIVELTENGVDYTLVYVDDLAAWHRIGCLFDSSVDTSTFLVYDEVDAGIFVSDVVSEKWYLYPLHEFGFRGFAEDLDICLVAEPGTK
jgi:hypothetical protein